MLLQFNPDSTKFTIGIQSKKPDSLFPIMGIDLSGFFKSHFDSCLDLKEHSLIPSQEGNRYTLKFTVCLGLL